MGDDIHYDGLFCKGCGLKESNAAWDAGTVGCPECNTHWPGGLTTRSPHSGGPAVHVFEPGQKADPRSLAATVPFVPQQGVWVVHTAAVVIREDTCPTCDGTGRVGPASDPRRTKCPGAPADPAHLVSARACHAGVLQTRAKRWTVSPGMVVTVTAVWSRLYSEEPSTITARVSYGGFQCEQREGCEDEDGDTPYVCATRGKANRIAHARNRRIEEDE